MYTAIIAWFVVLVTAIICYKRECCQGFGEFIIMFGLSLVGWIMVILLIGLTAQCIVYFP